MFGGDPTFKLFIQWVATSRSGRSMRYFVFGDSRMTEISEICENIFNQRKIGNIGELCKILFEYNSHVEASPGVSFLEYLLSTLNTSIRGK